MDEQPQTHLLALCGAIGGYEKTRDGGHGIYVPGYQAAECLRDIKRYLRQDEQDKTRPVAQLLSEQDLVKQHVAPLLRVMRRQMDAPQEEDRVIARKIVRACLEVLVPLTWPVDLTAASVLTQIQALRGYKVGLAKPDVLAPFLTLVVEALRVEAPVRTPRDKSTIRLGLYLIRNLLAVRDPSQSALTKAVDFEQTVAQERLLLVMQETRWMELIISLTATCDHRWVSELVLPLTEIVYGVLRTCQPSQVWRPPGGASLAAFSDATATSAAWKASTSVRTRGANWGGTLAIQMENGQQINIHRQSDAYGSLLTALDRAKKARRLPYAHARHGTDLTSRVLQTRQAFKKQSDEDYRHGKGSSATPSDFDADPRLVFPQTSRVLQHYVILWMTNAASTQLGVLKRIIAAQQPNVFEPDIHRYTFLLRYALLTHAWLARPDSPARLLPTFQVLPFETLASQLGLHVLEFLLVRTQNAAEAANGEHLQLYLSTLTAFCKILANLYESPSAAAAAAPADGDPEAAAGISLYSVTADHILSRLFYEEDRVKDIANLCRSVKFLGLDLHVALIDTIDTLLALLRRFAASKRQLIVRQKVRRQKRRQAKEQQARDAARAAAQRQAATSALEGPPRNGDVAVSTDALEPTTEDTAETAHKTTAEDEAALGSGSESDAAAEGSDAERRAEHWKETDFSMARIHRVFCYDTVVQMYIRVLAEFRTLAPSTVLQIVKMLYLISVTCRMPAYLYRLTVLQLFGDILSQARQMPRIKEYRELLVFVQYILQDFFKVLERRPSLFLEILFSKTKLEATRITMNPRDAELAARYRGPRDAARRDHVRPPVRDLYFKRKFKFSAPQCVQWAAILVYDEGHRRVVDALVDQMRQRAVQKAARQAVFDAAALGDGDAAAAPAEAFNEADLVGVDTALTLEGQPLVAVMAQCARCRLLMRMLDLEDPRVTGRAAFAFPPHFGATELTMLADLVAEAAAMGAQDVELPEKARNMADLVSTRVPKPRALRAAKSGERRARRPNPDGDGAATASSASSASSEADAGDGADSDASVPRPRMPRRFETFNPDASDSEDEEEADAHFFAEERRRRLARKKNLFSALEGDDGETAPAARSAFPSPELLPSSQPPPAHAAGSQDPVGSQGLGGSQAARKHGMLVIESDDDSDDDAAAASGGMDGFQLDPGVPTPAKKLRLDAAATTATDPMLVSTQGEAMSEKQLHLFAAQYGVADLLNSSDEED